MKTNFIENRSNISYQKQTISDKNKYNENL